MQLMMKCRCMFAQEYEAAACILLSEILGCLQYLNQNIRTSCEAYVHLVF